MSQNGDLVPLQPDERELLAELEAVVERGMQTFIEVGQALMAIRDQRLYRETHSSFEKYLDERWGISRAQGYRVIDAARVADAVSPIGDVKNEAIARELAPLLREGDGRILAECYAAAVAEYGDTMTAKVMRGQVRLWLDDLRRKEQERKVRRERASKVVGVGAPHDSNFNCTCGHCGFVWNHVCPRCKTREWNGSWRATRLPLEDEEFPPSVAEP
jgi:rubrerythrin